MKRAEKTKENNRDLNEKKKEDTKRIKNQTKGKQISHLGWFKRK